MVENDSPIKTADQSQIIINSKVNFQTFEKYTDGILPAKFELFEGAYLKVDIYEDGSNNYDPSSLRIRDIRIPKENRGQGLGQTLQRALLDECSKRKIISIYGSTQNPFVLLSWMKIPEVKDKIKLRTFAGEAIDLNAFELEQHLRDIVAKKQISNSDTQPAGTPFLDYVIQLS